jgi:hypothetical protein
MHLKSPLEQTKELRADLNNHSVYESLNNLSNLSHFMHYHAFAVWDFMSLVKYLQRTFTCTSLPWIPPKNASVARFINEIVLAEESDVMPNGVATSHFDMYLLAMEEVQTDTSHIRGFINAVANETRPMTIVLEQMELDESIKNFLNFTFSTIESGKDHCVAATFAFGREDIIPEMVTNVVSNIENNAEVPAFKYYLERHIELDGDEHGPMALEMMSAICGDDAQKWQEATDTVIEALKQRISFCTSIELSNPKLLSNAYK